MATSGFIAWLLAKKRAPAMVVSSSAVARIYKGFLSGLAVKFLQTCKIKAKKPFMSQVPKPKNLSS